MHEQIGVFGRQAPALELLFEFEHRVDHLRVAPAQHLLAFGDVFLQPRQRFLSVVFEVEIADAHRRLEVDQREYVLRGQLRRVGVPEEKRVDRAGVFVHEMHEIEDARVVLGRLDAYVVQRGGVAEEVLGGVGVGVEHVAGGVHLARLLRAVGEQKVEVRIDAQDQLLRRAGDHPHQHLLPLGKVGTVGYRDFEAQVGVLEVVEDAAPEGHVFVAFDVDLHQPLVGIGRQRFGQLFESRRAREGIESAQFVAELFSHTETKIVISAGISFQGRDFLQRRDGRFRSSAPPFFCVAVVLLHCRLSFCAAVLCAVFSLRRRRFFSGSALPLLSRVGVRRRLKG